MNRNDECFHYALVQIWLSRLHSFAWVSQKSHSPIAHLAIITSMGCQSIITLSMKCWTPPFVSILSFCVLWVCWVYLSFDFSLGGSQESGLFPNLYLISLQTQTDLWESGSHSSQQPGMNYCLIFHFSTRNLIDKRPIFCAHMLNLFLRLGSWFLSCDRLYQYMSRVVRFISVVVCHAHSIPALCHENCTLFYMLNVGWCMQCGAVHQYSWILYASEYITNALHFYGCDAVLVTCLYAIRLVQDHSGTALACVEWTGNGAGACIHQLAVFKQPG